MLIGSPWSDSYIQHQRKEQSSVMNIYQFVLIFIFILLLIQLIHLVPTTINLSNLVCFPWTQLMYIFQQVKYPVTHQKRAGY